MDRQTHYVSLQQSLPALLKSESDWLAGLANICSLLYTTLDFFWIGFYRVQENSLRLGPFQGPVACSRIEKGKGVCGKAWENDQTLRIKDVHAFEGHIACHPDSRSEIVIPLKIKQQIVGILDIDSTQINAFSAQDALALEALMKKVEIWLASTDYPRLS